MDVSKVADVLEAKIGRPLRMDAVAAAEGIIEVANNAMSDAIRFVLAEKGVDQRDFAIFAFGGAGPLHAADLARQLGVPRVLVPLLPGITSALGCVLSDVRHDYGVTVAKALDEIDGKEIDQLMRAQREQGESLIAKERVQATAIEASHEADLLYAGQTHVMRIAVEYPGFDPREVAQRFSLLYRERFGVDLAEMRPVLMAVRTTVIGRRGSAAAFPEAPPGALSEPSAERQIRFNGEWHDTPVYRRDEMAPGATLRGPVIVEQMDTTTLVGPNDELAVDRWGNLIIAVDRWVERQEDRDAA